MPPMSMGMMGMGMPFGFPMMGGFPMMSSHMMMKPFLLSQRMAMPPPMLYPPMRPPMMPMMGYGGMRMGMGMRPMPYVPRLPYRRYHLRRPRYPPMRHRYFPQTPTRTPTAYLSTRGPATTYYNPGYTSYSTGGRYAYRSYPTNYRYRSYGSVDFDTPEFETRSGSSRKSFDIDFELEDDMAKNVYFYNRYDNGNSFAQMQSPYIKSRGNYYGDFGDDLKGL